jgi:hypothetical protein
MASTRNPLSSWTAERQARYRQQHAEAVITFHFLLDASPSMIGANAANLRKAYNMYLAWLQGHANPMSLVELVVFSTPLTRHPVQALGSCLPLTEQTYNPLEGHGTALYRAVGEVVTTVQGTGQHVLVVFTDGGDNTSKDFAWTHTKASLLVRTLQAEDNWLCVFLGAFPEALAVGTELGCADNNCLVFTSDQIPAAFRQLTQATARYLLAAPVERKLLAAKGIF